MLQDYRELTEDQHEAIERQTLRTMVQAVQEYSKEAKDIFDNTLAPRSSEVIVLAEDLVQYALEVAECFPINKRFAGFIDYKRVRWISTPFGLLPQAFLVDAKASTENNRDTLQLSQLPMDAEFESAGSVVRLSAGVPPHLEIPSTSGVPLLAVTASAFLHFYYKDVTAEGSRYRTLKAIYALMLPHQRLKQRYNPSPDVTFFGQGKQSPKLGEEPRIRVYFTRLKQMCPWRLQELRYDGPGYAKPLWRDTERREDGSIHEVLRPFDFIGR